MRTETRLRLMLICVTIVCVWLMWYLPPAQGIKDSPKDTSIILPSPTELQVWVNCVLAEANKPLLKVDGQLGHKDSKFRIGYEAAYCYQSGASSMKGAK